MTMESQYVPPEDGEHGHTITPRTFAEAVAVIQAQQSMRTGWKYQLTAFARQLAVAVITSAVIVAGLVIGFSGQTQAQIERDEATLHANLAQACVLSLPVDPETGRSEKDVQRCFTQYGLQAPELPKDARE